MQNQELKKIKDTLLGILVFQQTLKQATESVLAGLDSLGVIDDNVLDSKKKSPKQSKQKHTKFKPAPLTPCQNVKNKLAYDAEHLAKLCDFVVSEYYGYTFAQGIKKKILTTSTQGKLSEIEFLFYPLNIDITKTQQDKIIKDVTKMLLNDYKNRNKYVIERIFLAFVVDTLLRKNLKPLGEALLDKKPCDKLKMVFASCCDLDFFFDGISHYKLKELKEFLAGVLFSQRTKLTKTLDVCYGIGGSVFSA